MLLALEKLIAVKNTACSLTWIDTEVDYEANVALLRPYISTLTILHKFNSDKKKKIREEDEERFPSS